MKKKKEHFGAFTAAYALSNGGGFMLIQATMGSYFTLYLTDTLKIPAGTASAMLFIAMLIDALKEPFVGGIVDRTHTKVGRYKTYFLFAPILFVAIAIMLFSGPESMTSLQKGIYVFIFYLLYGLFSSLCSTSAQAVLPAQILDTKRRNTAVMFATASTAAAFTIASSFNTNFLAWAGSYSHLFLVYGILMVPSYLVLFFLASEQYITAKEKRPVTDDVKLLFRRKELLPIILVWCLGNLGYGIMFSASTYYVMYYLKRVDLISAYMLTISMGALISMTLLLPIVMKLCKTPKRALIITQAVTAGCYLILMLVHMALPVLFVLSFIAAAICSMQLGLMGMLLNDCIDYMELKEGIGLNGLLSSLRGFANKFGSAFTTPFILLTLSLTGYVPGDIENQSAATSTAINALRFGLPIITAAGIILIMSRYPIQKYYPEIQKMKEDRIKDRMKDREQTENKNA